MLRYPMLLVLACGCHSAESDAEPANIPVEYGPNSNAVSSGSDSGAPNDSGQAHEPVEPLRLEGRMAAEYTYSGSLGEFTDVCEGDAFITIDAESVIAGEGTCANAIISFGFVIEGTQEGQELAGNLVGETSAGRAETPFSGPLNTPETVLNFDHIHAADGESIRLVGSLNLMVSE